MGICELALTDETLFYSWGASLLGLTLEFSFVHDLRDCLTSTIFGYNDVSLNGGW